LHEDGRATKWAASVYGSTQEDSFIRLEPPSSLFLDTDEPGKLNLTWEYTPSAIDAHLVAGFFVYIKVADKNDAKWTLYNVKERKLDPIPEEMNPRRKERYRVNLLARSLEVQVAQTAKYQAMIFLSMDDAAQHENLEEAASAYGIQGRNSIPVMKPTPHGHSLLSQMRSARQDSSTMCAYETTQYRMRTGWRGWVFLSSTILSSAAYFVLNDNGVFSDKREEAAIAFGCAFFLVILYLMNKFHYQYLPKPRTIGFTDFYLLANFLCSRILKEANKQGDTLADSEGEGGGVSAAYTKDLLHQVLLPLAPSSSSSSSSSTSSSCSSSSSCSCSSSVLLSLPPAAHGSGCD
jgi:hypothetical protein